MLYHRRQPAVAELFLYYNQGLRIVVVRTPCYIIVANQQWPNSSCTIIKVFALLWFGHHVISLSPTSSGRTLPILHSRYYVIRLKWMKSRMLLAYPRYTIPQFYPYLLSISHNAHKLTKTCRASSLLIATAVLSVVLLPGVCVFATSRFVTLRYAKIRRVT